MPAVSPRRPTAHWRALLEGSASDEAYTTVQEIAQAVRGWAPGPEEKSQPGGSACLASGYAGIALFFAYLARTRFDPSAATTAQTFLENAMDLVAAEAMNPSLYCGFAGVAWATAHLQEQLFGCGDNATQAIDDALADFVSQTPWSGDFDLVNGLVGFGVYALERLPDPSGVRLLERIVDCLAECSTVIAPGRAWFTDPRWSSSREKYPRGYFNLGVAHGTPGVIALLASAYARGVNAAKARSLLADAVAWLLAQEFTDGDWIGFGPWLEPGVKPAKSRLAWCYGDPGIAIALFSAARAVGDAAWEDKACAIARRAARCPLDQSAVRDTCLCHGAAGAGHLFNRLYQATGEAALARASRFWFERALAMRVPGRGVAGYELFWSAEKGVEAWRADAGFLMGAAGIGLALLAAITPIEPAWDRLLLTALPPAGQPAGE